MHLVLRLLRGELAVHIIITCQLISRSVAH